MQSSAWPTLGVFLVLSSRRCWYRCRPPKTAEQICGTARAPRHIQGRGGPLRFSGTWAAVRPAWPSLCCGGCCPLGLLARCPVQTLAAFAARRCHAVLA